ncbi:hypothetical protein [Kitasatospora mediocidica]|uniref:hypothetical protein n=1 Tax=Kitasatospora mediocidica TaxID=58352 RepID=UPI00055ED1D0|nr:hypothetical protein [Kitasatospora mediocidica]
MTVPSSFPLPPRPVDFSVEPELLTAGGRALQSVGQALPDELPTLHRPSDAASTALSGWRTAAALDRCTGAWTERLKALAVDLDDKGARLVTTAAGYHDTNASVAQGMTELLAADSASRARTSGPAATPYRPAFR